MEIKKFERFDADAIGGYWKEVTAEEYIDKLTSNIPYRNTTNAFIFNDPDAIIRGHFVHHTYCRKIDASGKYRYYYIGRISKATFDYYCYPEGERPTRWQRFIRWCYKVDLLPKQKAGN